MGNKTNVELIVEAMGLSPTYLKTLGLWSHIEKGVAIVADEMVRLTQEYAEETNADPAACAQYARSVILDQPLE